MGALHLYQLDQHRVTELSDNNSVIIFQCLSELLAILSHFAFEKAPARFETYKANNNYFE